MASIVSSVQRHLPGKAPKTASQYKLGGERQHLVDNINGNILTLTGRRDLQLVDAKDLKVMNLVKLDQLLTLLKEKVDGRD